MPHVNGKLNVSGLIKLHEYGGPASNLLTVLRQP